MKCEEGGGSATYLGGRNSLETVAGLSDAKHSSLGTFSVRRRHCGRPYVEASERMSLMWPYLKGVAATGADDDLQADVSGATKPCKWGTERIKARLQSESQHTLGTNSCSLFIVRYYSRSLIYAITYILPAWVPHSPLKQSILQLRRHSASSTQNREVMPCAALASLFNFYWPTFRILSGQLRG